jgi:hypothetical protein
MVYVGQMDCYENCSEVLGQPLMVFKIVRYPVLPLNSFIITYRTKGIIEGLYAQLVWADYFASDAVKKFS